MQNYQRNLILFSLSLALLLIAAPSQPALAAQVETSVVRLDLNGQKFSESFELVDTGETVLVPLRALAVLLDADVSLDPASMTAKVARSWDKQEATLDLNRQAVTLSGREVEMAPAAVAAAGDFFLPVPAAEALFDAKVEWNAKRQSLLVSAERELSVLKAAIPEMRGQPTPAKPGETAKKPQDAAPWVSLGSVQYVLNNTRSSQKDRWPNRDDLRFDVHLQAGGVPIDVSGKAKEFFSDKRQWSLDRATAIYRSPALEAVLGDTWFSLGRVQRDASIRGLRFSSPSSWSANQLYALTVLAGEAPPRAVVELTINGYFLGRVTAGDDGSYEFTSVPLQILKPNVVVITVAEENGNRSSETRTIAAVPRLVPEGRWYTSGGYGLVRPELGGGGTGQDGTQEQEQEFSAIMAAGSAYAGLSPGLTAGGEIAHRVEIDSQLKPDGPGVLSGNIGATARASDNLILSLDWMLSRPDDVKGRPDQGGELAANLQLGRMAWQSVVFYREPKLVLFSRTPTDTKGYSVMTEYDVSQELNFGFGYERSQPVSEPDAKPTTKLEAVVRVAPYTTDTAVLKLEREVKVKDKVQFNYKRSTPSTEFKLETSGDWNEDGSERARISNGRFEAELNHAWGTTAALSVSRDDSLSWRWNAAESVQSPAPSPTRRSTSEIQLSWFPGNYQLTATAKLRQATSPGGAEGQGLSSQAKAGIDFSRAFGSTVAGVAAEVSRDFQFKETTLANSVYLGAQSRDIRGEGLSGQLKLDYIKPLWSSLDTESLKATLDVEYLFGGGFLAGVKGFAERTNWQKTDYYLGFTISQGLGFSNGEIRGFRAMGGRPLGYVDGIVYADLNRNGKRDPDEKTLAGIPMALGGRRTVTDQNGYYIFEFVNSGVFSLGPDPAKLPADYTPVTEAKLIKLPTNANFTQDFGLALNGTIEGFVFLDFNHDGKPDAGEPEPAWIKLLLDGKTESFTDENGAFTFGNVDPGKHVLTVDPKNLPPGIAPPPPITVEIKEDALDVWDVFVPLTQTGQTVP